MYQLTFLRHGCLHKVSSPDLTSLYHLRKMVPHSRLWKLPSHPGKMLDQAHPILVK